MMLRNRWMWCSVALTGALLLIRLSSVQAGRPEPWRQDYNEAAAMSKKSGRPLLLHFHASWCGPCRQMEQGVLHKDEVKDLLSNSFIAVRIDSDKRPDLREQFKIEALPTDLVLDSDGRVLSRSEGYRDKRAYVEQLRRALQQATNKSDTPADPVRDQKLVQKEPSPTRTELDPSPNNSNRSIDNPSDQKPDLNTKTSDNKTKLLVGMDRYSPVSLARSRQWRKGKSEFALVYQGVVYLLCDDTEYREFKSDPAKFAPRLLGCDPVVLWTADKAVPGSTQYGAYFDGELFLFSSADTRARFKQSPTLYSRPQHVLKVDQIDGPRWR